MLKIHIPARDFYNEKTEEFFTTKDTDIVLEHSLVSVSKWESKWHKPFLDNRELTDLEFIDYIRCMTITQNVDKNIYFALSSENIKQIREYMNETMTATTFNKINQPTGDRDVITAEFIYYYMISYNIPFECQKWHLNKLLALIEVFNRKNSKDNKMSMSDIYSTQRSLNEARRKALHTKG